MLNRSVFMLICVAVLGTHPSLSQSWTSLIGPSVTVAPKDMSSTSTGVTVFMAEQDFILRSTDSGISWKGTPDEYVSPEVVQVKLSDGSIVLAAKEGELVRSVDTGTSWVTEFEEEDLFPLGLFNVINNNDIFLLCTEYMADKSPIRLSTDNGNN